MPVMSVIILFILIYLCIKKNSWLDTYTNLFVLTCVLHIMWLQGYFFKIGGTYFFNIHTLSSAFLFFYSLYIVYMKKIKLEWGTTMNALVFIVVIAIGMFYEFVFPYDGLLMPQQDEYISWDKYVAGTCVMYQYAPTLSSYIRSFIEIFIFSFQVIVFKHVYNDIWFIHLYMKVVGWTKIIIYYGIIEFILKNVFGNTVFTFELADILLGSDGRTAGVVFRGTNYALQGLSREPSQFNVVIFTIVLLMLFGNMLRRVAKNRHILIPDTYGNVSLVLGIVLLFFTGGFSSIWFLLIIGACAALLTIRESENSMWNFLVRKKFTILFFAMIIFSILHLVIESDYLYNRLEDAFLVIDYLNAGNGFQGITAFASNEEISSTIARFVSVYEGWQIFISRPFLGLSWKIQPLHDFSMVIFANMGIAGAYTLYRMLITAKVKKDYDHVMILLIYIIGGLPITSSSDGLCLYWLLFIEATTFYMNSIKRNEVSS